jgi:hypothetical protein
MDRRLDGSQGRFGHSGEKKYSYLYPLPRTELRVSGRVSRSSVTFPTELTATRPIMFCPNVTMLQAGRSRVRVPIRLIFQLT